MKIGFIGCGNMTVAILVGALKSFNKEDIYISNRTEQKAMDLAEKYGVNFCKTNRELCDKSDIIIVGVKPNDYETVLKEISPKDKIIVSIAAGITIKYLKSLCPKCKIVRTMPNTPVKLGLGVTGVTFSKEISDVEKQFIIDFFASSSKVIEVDEDKMDLVVGLSGSSPAYSYMFVDAMAKAGEKLGLDYETSLYLAANTIIGAMNMVLNEEDNPKVLCQKVCSKGGTTIEGVSVLENDLDELMFKTIDAVVRKSKKLTK